MTLLQDFFSAIVAMVVLGVGSAFFSCSEAALFSLQPDDRRALRRGTAGQRRAEQLLDQPDRLLVAILFWNLVLNMTYFALASIVSLQLERQLRHAEAGLMAVGSLVAIILCSEMIPKTVGVLAPRTMARVLSLPLSVAVRLFRPLAPLFASIIAAVRRLLMPNFRIEPYLELTDLEQAITVSAADEELAAQERSALHNIILLSDLRAEELRRPRTQYRTFTPPVSLEDLGGEPTRSGYLLVSEPDSDEVASAIALNLLPTLPRQHLEQFASPVVYLPWCASVAVVFDELQSQNCEVAAILNELGETIGIVTLDDLLTTILEVQSSRSARLLQTASIESVGDQVWHVTGMTSLRRLGRTFRIALPKSKSITVTGIIQESLQRMPDEGDIVDWPPFRFRVIESDALGVMKVELTLVEQENGES